MISPWYTGRLAKARSFCCLVFLVVSALAGDCVSATPSVDPIARWKAFYEQTDSLEADFRQVILDEDGKVVERSSGHVILARPDRFRWEYHTPYRQVIISDGAVIKHYDPDLAQVTVRRTSEAMGATPAQLLAGRLDVAEHFEISASADASDGLYWIKLSPRERTGDFESIRLGFEGSMLTQMAFIDGFDQETQVRLDNIRVNQTVAPGAFSLDLPEGVDVVGDPVS